MANIKAAIKNIKTTERKTIENKSKKSAIKTYIRNFEEAIDAENIEEAQELLKVIDKKLKQAEHKNVIHRNSVARKMSRLTKQLNEAM
ncbi:MAG TPA: 30S ribosomal protein S20 [Tissierellaceae bacterium]|nr:30S ribosomal protein S20 [Tissierellaceae bacterium]